MSNRFLMLFFFTVFVNEGLKAQMNTRFVWGINGHPLTQEAYGQSSWKLQVLFLKELGVGSYRIDVPLNSNGIIRNDMQFKNFAQVLSEAKISIMPVIFPKFNNNDTDSVAVYISSFKEGKLFCEQYQNWVDVLEVGNELEVKLLKRKGTVDGTSEKHYDLAKSRQLMWNLAGFIDGMKSIKPKIRVSLSLGWTHWYYLELLKIYRVNYDIIGYHWYDNMGDITNVAKPYGNFLPKLMAKYGKEIWITEFNTYKGTLKKSVEKQNMYLDSSLSKILKQGIIKGFFFYELFDEPALMPKSPQEACYGVLSKKNGSYQKKPVFNTYKQFIKKSIVK